jgi:hypothetical protein
MEDMPKGRHELDGAAAPESPPAAAEATIGKWQARGIAALIAAIALGLAAYAAAASYDTVSALAVTRGVSLPRLNPVGIDGGLFGIIIVDIAFTWAGSPIWWLRLAARLFAALTVAANASAGWPDPVGVGLRIAAPTLFIIIVEAGRRFLLRSRHAAEAERRAAERAERRGARERARGDRIPRMRWLLDFRGTLSIWKRMQLWREPSYAKAVSMELERLAAIEKLAMMYRPEEWQARAPADLVWMLTAGVRMSEALARVAELTARPSVAEPRADAGGRASVPPRKRAAHARPEDAQGGAQASAAAPRTQLEIVRAARAKADRILAGNPGISGAALAEECGMKPRWGQTYKKQFGERAEAAS